MNYYESSANNTADSISPSVRTRLTADITDGTLEELRLTARRLPPAPLREHNQWVCWEYEQQGNRTTKPPIDPHTGGYASVRDPSTWADYETALRHYQQESVDGVGFVLTENDPFAGIDWDNCRDATTGTIDEWVRDELDELDSYSEVSPSGTGVHTLLYGDVPQARGNQNEKQGIEVYDSGRYFTVSSQHIESTPLTIENRTEELSILYSVYIREVTEDSNRTAELPNISEDVDKDEIEYAESLLRDFHTDAQTTQRAREYLHDLLNGHYRSRGFIAKDGTADRSEAETALVSKLFGIFRQYEDEDKALELADTYITHSCEEQPRTADGQPRKWLTSEIHRREALKTVSQEFDSKIWKKWRWKKNNWDTWSDDYSHLTYKRVLDAVFALAREDSYEYPTKDKILDFAQEMDPSRDKTTHQTVLYRLRDGGDIKMAYLGGNEYVYYPADLSDPPDAEWIKIGDEQYSPSSSA